MGRRELLENMRKSWELPAPVNTPIPRGRGRATGSRNEYDSNVRGSYANRTADGGEILGQLEAERNSLSVMEEELTNMAKIFNGAPSAKAQQVAYNMLGEKYNQLYSRYTAAVESYNQKAGSIPYTPTLLENTNRYRELEQQKAAAQAEEEANAEAIAIARRNIASTYYGGDTNLQARLLEREYWEAELAKLTAPTKNLDLQMNQLRPVIYEQRVESALSALSEEEAHLLQEYVTYGKYQSGETGRDKLRGLGWSEETIDLYAEYMNHQLQKGRSEDIQEFAGQTAKFLQDAAQGVPGLGNIPVVQDFIAAAGTVPIAAVQGVAGLPGMFSKGSMDEFGYEVNPNSGFYNIQNFRNGILQTLEEDVINELEKQFPNQAWVPGVASFAFNTAMSIEECAFMISTFGPAAPIIFGANAASATAQEVAKRGGSRGQVITLAAAAGLAEYLWERTALDHLLKLTSATDPKAFMKQVWRQMGVESLEEIGTETTNIVADWIVMGNSSKTAAMAQQFMDELGVDYETAMNMAWAQNAKQIGLSGLAGAISGGFMGGGRIMQRNAVLDEENRQIGAEVREAGELGAANYDARTGQVILPTAEQLQASGGQTGYDAAQRAVETGLRSEIGTDSRRLAEQAQKKLEKGKKLTDTELGRLTRANEEAIEAEASRAYMDTSNISPVTDEDGNLTMPTFEQYREDVRHRVQENYARQIEEEVRRLGVTNVEVVELPEGASATFDEETGKVQISSRISRQSIVDAKVGHEVAHAVQKADDTFTGDMLDVMKKLGFDTDTMINERSARDLKWYKAHPEAKGAQANIKKIEADSFAYGASEIVADFIGDAVHDRTKLEAIARSNKANVFLRAVERLREIYTGTERSVYDVLATRLKEIAKEQTPKEAKKGAESATERQEAKEDVTDIETELVAIDEQGTPVALQTADGHTHYSLSTFKDSGRDILQAYLEKQVAAEEMTQEDADDILESMDAIYDVCNGFKDEYGSFGEWSDAKVVTDAEGNPIFSVVKANGEYVMNLDFSLICKKRRALNAVFNEMINRGIMDDFNLSQEAVVEINNIIREHGLEVACALCFVDAKRFRVAKVADDFVKIYNGLVKSMAKGAAVDSFNFANAPIEKVEGGIDTMDDSQLDFSRLDAIIRNVEENNGKKIVNYKVAKYLREHPEGRKLLHRSDFMTDVGFENVQKEAPEVMKLYNAKKGSGGPKAAFGDVQYLSDIIQSRKFDAEKAYAVGGVRIQSFSDYVARLVFDYVQMIGDLAAKQLPAHAYTKEALFVKQFGLTGIKINMSLIPKVERGGMAPGLDAEGNYVWADESFDYDTAIEIQNAEGYSANCGTIAVGVSNEHIRMLLEDENIRMVIPYHKSGLNAVVARMNLINEFTDYTDSQNTRYQNGKKLSDGDMAKVPEFNQLLRETGDPRAAAEEYVRWCEDHDYLPKFDQFAYQTIDGVNVEEDGKRVVNPNYYKLLIDFAVYDNGRYTPQGAVKAVFPTEDDAFGCMRDLIQEGLKEDQKLTDDRNAKVGAIVDEIEKAWGIAKPAGGSLQYSLDADYMDAVERGDMETAQRMVDEAAKAAGHNIKLYHGTAGEPFYVFRQGAEGIHFGTIAQATRRAEIAQQRYESRFVTYHADDIRSNPGKYPDGARRSIIDYIATTLPVDFSQEEIDAAYALIESNAPISDSVLFEYLDRAERECGAKTYRLSNTAMQKAGDGRVIPAYVKAQSPMIFDVDIGEWIPANLAAILIDKINGQTTQIYDPRVEEWVSYDPKNIQGIELTEEDIFQLERLQNYYSMEFEEMAKFLQSKGVDSIRYLNTYEGTGNEESYILLSREQVKSAEPVTYDDDGNVIPLSERFNEESDDIRYSLDPTDAEYMAAVRNKSNSTMERMVREEARRNFYDTPKLYRGTENATRTILDPDKAGGAIYATPSLKAAKTYSRGSTKMNLSRWRPLWGLPNKNGIYELYGKTIGKKLVIDAEGHAWNDLRAPELGIRGITSTRAIAEVARKQGYKTVIIKNCRHSRDPKTFDEPTDIYIFFDATQLKSAANVTYDDFGRVIPLSKRFNSSKKDLRYSIDIDIFDVNGKKYDKVVVLDQNAANPIINNQAAFDHFVRTNLVGQQIEVYDENGNPEVIEFARESDRVKKEGAKNSHPVLGEILFSRGYMTRMVIVNANEVTKESTPEPRYEDHQHKWLDENGWSKRTAYVTTEERDTVYPAELLIAHARDGRNILYRARVNNKEGVAIDPSKQAQNNNEPADNQNHNTHAEKVPENPEIVKRDYSIDPEALRSERDAVLQKLGQLQTYGDREALTEQLRKLEDQIAQMDERGDKVPWMETETQAQQAGYPVIDGKQVFPYRTWVRDKERGNYGLVIGQAGEKAGGGLIVSFWNKDSGKRASVRKFAEDLETVTGSYQPSDAELTELFRSEPVAVEREEISQEDLDEYASWNGVPVARGAAPAVSDQTGELPKRVQTYLQITERGLVNRLGEALNVPSRAKRDFLNDVARSISNEYLQEGRVSEETVDKMFEAAYEVGVIADREFYDQYKHVLDYLRSTKITLAERDQADIADFKLWRKGTFGRLRLVNEGGQGADTAYMELQEMAPELFPDDITHPADQVQHMFEVAKSIHIVEKHLDDYFGSQAEEFRAWAKNDFAEAVNGTLTQLRNVKRYVEDRARKAEKEAPVTQEQLEDAFRHMKDARRGIEKAQARNLLTDRDEMQVGRLLRGEIQLKHLDPAEDNVRGITEVYKAKAEYEQYSEIVGRYNRARKAALYEQAERFLENSQEWKDKGELRYERETAERNIRDVVKDDAAAQQIIDAYFTPVHRAAAEANRLKNNFRHRVKALDLSRKVEKGNLVSEAHAVQLYGEAMDNIAHLESKRAKKNKDGTMKTKDGKTADEWRSVIQDLWNENPKLDRAKIEGAVAEFRSIYDELFQQMNQARLRNGYEPVDYRRGYFPHFQLDVEDKVLAKIGKAMGIRLAVDNLPTDIIGTTHTFKPGIRWIGNAQKRLGFNTVYDAVEGFDRYIEGVADVIYQTDNIQRLRALATQIRYRASDEGVKEQIRNTQDNPTLDDDQKHAEIERITRDGRYALGNLVQWLEEYTNNLANKKSQADRWWEKKLGRGFYTFMKNMESHVAANMIVPNVGSWLTNTIPLTQAWAALDTKTLLQGMWDTLRAYKADDGFAATSDFLTNRRGSDPLAMTWAERATQTIGSPMTYIDRFTADSLVRARFTQNKRKGMSDEAAMADADSFAASVIADRSKGAMPTAFNEANPVSKLLTQFQLEVNNQFSFLFKDLPREKKDEGIARLVAAFLKFFLGAFLYNEVYEYFIGRRSALDPIGILNDTVGDISGYQLPNLVELGVGAITGDMPSFRAEKEDPYGVIEGLTTNIGEELPFVGGLVFDGGRIPISSAVPDVRAIVKSAVDQDMASEKKWANIGKEFAKPTLYWLPPFGGGQVKKIFQGLKAAIKGGSYSMDSEGNDILQYPVYNENVLGTAGNVAKAMLFGKSSFGTAQDWVDSGFKSLGANETAVYQAMTAEADVGAEDAFELIQELRGAEKTDTQSLAEVQLQILRRSDVNDMGKALVYYGLIASEEEQYLMDAMEDLDADMGEVGGVMMDIREAEPLTGYADGNAKRQALLDSNLTETQKIVIYHEKISDGRDEDIQAFQAAGMTVDQFLEAHNAYAQIDDEYETNSEKSRAFSSWAYGQNMTVEQMDVAKEIFTYYNQVPANANRYDEMRENGMSDESTNTVLDITDDLEPEEGKDRVEDIQYYRAIAESPVSDLDKEISLEAFMDESAFAKFSKAKDAGIDMMEYIEFLEATGDMKSIKDANGKEVTSKKSQVLEYIDSLNLTDDQKDALYYAAGYKESTIDDAPWHGGWGGSGWGSSGWGNDSWGGSDWGGSGWGDSGWG